MNRSFIYKILSIFGLVVLMSIAISYVNHIIIERQLRQEQVISQVSSSSVREQTIVGPVLVVPYTEHYYEKVYMGEKQPENLVKRSQEHTLYLLPSALKLNGKFSNQYKSISIYNVLQYSFGGHISGQFDLNKIASIQAEYANGSIELGNAYLSVGISDPRGIHGTPSFKWESQNLEVAQGSKTSTFASGIHADIGTIPTGTKTASFDLDLRLRGTHAFNFVPIASNNLVDLGGQWPHPHFDGSFLPDSDSQVINDQGFSAHWSVSSLASSVQQALTEKLNQNTGGSLESISVGFAEPINIYSQADRATKYGLLFIGLTFAGFFVFEILKQFRIHPAQYSLVGLAMALFYLLLVSLSEHFNFLVSYLTASFACITLLGYYLSFVLKSKAHGLVFASLLTSLYGALYGILSSEDNALLMGSLLVFGLVAVTMVITRKVDWYQISGAPSR